MTDQIHLRQRSPWTAIPKGADHPHRTAVRQKSPWTAVPKVADHPHDTAVRQKSPWTAVPKVADHPHDTAVRQKSPWTAVPKVADHPHDTAVRQRSPWTAILKVADRPHRTAVRVDTAGRRCFLVLLAFGVAIQAWALFPSTVESESYVPLPEATAPSAADVNSARAGVVGNPLEFSRADAFTLMAAKLVSSNPTSYGLAAVGYSSPLVAVSLVPLRSKLRGAVDDVVFPVRRHGSGGSGGEVAGVAAVAGLRIGAVDGTP